MISLFPYQQPSADNVLRALREHRICCDCSDTGVGKSYVAAWVAGQLGRVVGVVCPKVIIPMWQRLLEPYGGNVLFVINYEKLRAGSTSWGKFNLKKWEWSPTLPQDALLIWDECHKCKGTASQNARMLAASKGRYNLCLSATLAQSPVDMRAIGYLLGLHNGAGFYKWCLRNGCWRGAFSQLEFKKKTAHKYLTEIHSQIFPDKGSRIRIADLGDAFPDNFVTAEVYAFGNEDAVDAAYAAVQEEQNRRILAGEPENVGALQMQARAKAEAIKADGLAAMAKDLIEEGNSVVIFTSFRETLEKLRAKLKCGGVYGGQHDSERNVMIDQFQRDVTRVIVVNIQAGGVGISLHDLWGRYPRVSLICPTFHAVDLKQALGRIHRAGAKSKAVQKIVFAAGTIEERICKRVQAKLDNIELLNDGDLDAVDSRLTGSVRLMTDEERLAQPSPWLVMIEASEAQVPHLSNEITPNEQFDLQVSATSVKSSTVEPVKPDETLNISIPVIESVSTRRPASSDSIGEEWRPAVGLPSYQISNYGRVKRALDSKRAPKDTLIKVRDQRGYPVVDLSENGKNLQRLVHRMVAEAFVSNPDNLPEVNHLDGRKCNNRFDNLAWTTHLGNMAHAYQTGLIDRSDKRRLSQEEVAELRAMLPDYSLAELGRVFGMSAPAVADIRDGVTYKQRPSDVTERVHAKLSPSKLKAKAVCPGFENDPSGDSKWADRGTLGHKAVEIEDASICGDDSQLIKGVETCIAYKRQLINKGDFELQEVRLDYFDQWGFADLFVFKGDHLDIVDWKFAVNFYAADSPQFWCYAIGAWDKWSNIETIRMHAAHPFRDEIDIEMWTRATDYERLSSQVASIIAKTRKNNPADYRVSAQCSYCGISKKCSKLARLGVDIARHYAPELVLPDLSLHGSEVTDPNTFAALLPLAPIIEKATGGWKYAARELAETGIDIPGYELAEKKGRRTVVSAKAAFEAIRSEVSPDLEADSFIDYCDIKASAVDELVRAASPRGKKAHMVEVVQNRLIEGDVFNQGGDVKYLRAIRK